MPRARKDYWESDAWRRLRWAVIKRDKYTCRRCLRKFRYGKGLTVHHVIPRPVGATVEKNLISLCDECHDFVESNGFLTIQEIEGRTLMPDVVAPPPVAVEDVHDWRDVDWRIIVYGGVKDFRKAKKIMSEQGKLDMPPQ